MVNVGFLFTLLRVEAESALHAIEAWVILACLNRSSGFGKGSFQKSPIAPKPKQTLFA